MPKARPRHAKSSGGVLPPTEEESGRAGKCPTAVPLLPYSFHRAPSAGLCSQTFGVVFSTGTEGQDLHSGFRMRAFCRARRTVQGIPSVEGAGCLR